MDRNPNDRDLRLYQKARSYNWVGLLIQTATLLAGGIIYANSQEHRITVIEESLRGQREVMEQQRRTQELLIEQVRQTEQGMQRLITLEDFIHGMSADEAEGYYRAKMKRQLQQQK